MKRAGTGLWVALLVGMGTLSCSDEVTTGSGSSGPGSSGSGSSGSAGGGAAGMGGAGQGGMAQGGAGQGGAGQGGMAQGGMGQGGMGQGGAGGMTSMPGNNGSPCTLGNECDGGFCISEPGDGWPSGACTELCDMAVGTCMFGGNCIDVGAPGGDGICLAACDVMANNCRDGYVCYAPPAGGAVCIGYCTLDTQCTVSGSCNLMEHLCDTPPGMTDTGLPCMAGFECKSNNNDGYCITEMDGWPSGYCTEFCDLANNDCAGDAICLDVGNGQGLCFDGCTMNSDCPTMGYSCTPVGMGASVCAPSGPANEDQCENFYDDDQDGLVDCQDPDCQAMPACQPGMKPTGQPCTMASECAANNSDPMCLAEDTVGWPSGYCSEFCNLMNNDCAGDAVCVDVGFGGGQGICLDGCNAQPNCQTPGYDCVDAGQMSKVCSPNCTADNQCQAYCNPDNGLCNPAQENCGDSMDNDNDNAIDCEDLSCAMSCQAAIDMACMQVIAAQPGANMGNTMGGSNLFSSNCTGSGSPERVYSYTAPQNGTLTITLDSAVNLGMYFRTLCNDKSSDVGCIESAPAGMPETISFPVQAGTSFLVFIDGATPADSGAYTLSFTIM